MTAQLSTPYTEPEPSYSPPQNFQHNTKKRAYVTWGLITKHLMIILRYDNDL